MTTRTQGRPAGERLRALALTPLYTTVGLGDLVVERLVARIGKDQHQVDSVTERDRGVTIATLTSLPIVGAAMGLRAAHSADREAGIPDAVDPPPTGPLLASLTSRLGMLGRGIEILVGRDDRERPNKWATHTTSRDPFDVSSSTFARSSKVAEAARSFSGARPRRTAASRTSSPAPAPHRQTVVEPEPPARMTGSRTVRPSGMEAASTATRAARRAAARAEQQ